MQYLVTDATTGNSTWIESVTPKEALILHENTLRAIGKGMRYRMPSIPVNAKVGRDDRADYDCWVGDSYIRGSSQSVTRRG